MANPISGCRPPLCRSCVRSDRGSVIKGEALYPVSLSLAGRPCLVVGGGPGAARKAAGLLGCGAVVTVVAPSIDPSFGSLAHRSVEPPLTGPDRACPGKPTGTVTVVRRRYERGEAARYRLVITATGVADVDRTVAADAEAAGVWVNSADDMENCTFLLPSVHRDGPVTIAVSTSGASPALAARLRRKIGEMLGPNLGLLAELLQEARRRIHAGGRSTESIDWHTMLDGPLPGLVRTGDVEGARDLLHRATAQPPPDL